MMKDFKKQITKHLEDYGKLEEIDATLIDQASFILTQIEDARKQILKHGVVHLTANGYSAKNGYLQAYEALMKSYVAISEKLGMSPLSREKLRWTKPFPKGPDDDLIK